MGHVYTEVLLRYFVNRHQFRGPGVCTGVDFAVIMSRVLHITYESKIDDIAGTTLETGR